MEEDAVASPIIDIVYQLLLNNNAATDSHMTASKNSTKNKHKLGLRRDFWDHNTIKPTNYLLCCEKCIKAIDKINSKIFL